MLDELMRQRCAEAAELRARTAVAAGAVDALCHPEVSSPPGHVERTLSLVPAAELTPNAVTLRLYGQYGVPYDCGDFEGWTRHHAGRAATLSQALDAAACILRRRSHSWGADDLTVLDHMCRPAQLGWLWDRVVRPAASPRAQLFSQWIAAAGLRYVPGSGLHGMDGAPVRRAAAQVVDAQAGDDPVLYGLLRRMAIGDGDEDVDRLVHSGTLFGTRKKKECRIGRW